MATTIMPKTPDSDKTVIQDTINSLDEVDLVVPDRNPDPPETYLDLTEEIVLEIMSRLQLGMKFNEIRKDLKSLDPQNRSLKNKQIKAVDDYRAERLEEIS